MAASTAPRGLSIISDNLTEFTDFEPKLYNKKFRNSLNKRRDSEKEKTTGMRFKGQLKCCRRTWPQCLAKQLARVQREIFDERRVGTHKVEPEAWHKMKIMRVGKGCLDGFQQEWGWLRKEPLKPQARNRKMSLLPISSRTGPTQQNRGKKSGERAPIKSKTGKKSSV